MEPPIKNNQPAVSPFAELRTKVRVRPATQPLGESPFHQQAVKLPFFPPSRWRHYFPPVVCPALSRHASPLEGMKSNPGQPATLGSITAAHFRLIVCARIAGIRSSPTRPRWLIQYKHPLTTAS